MKNVCAVQSDRSTDAASRAESDARYGSFDFRAAHAEADADLQALLDNNESLPFRRRGACALRFVCSVPAIYVLTCALRIRERRHAEERSRSRGERRFDGLWR